LLPLENSLNPQQRAARGTVKYCHTLTERGGVIQRIVVVLLLIFAVQLNSRHANADAPPAPQPQWKTAKVETIGDLTVSISEPVLITRNKQRRWFPTITRFDDGKLMAIMSAEADVVGVKPGKLVSWSTDGGLTWSAPVDQPAIHGGGTLRFPDGQWTVLPFNLIRKDDGSIGSPFPVISPLKETIQEAQGEITVGGWPRPLPDHDGKRGMSPFGFNRQAMQISDGTYLATIYGRFKGTKRLTLLLAESRDAKQWKIRGIIADDQCKLPGREGPNEAAICRLKDGRLMCVFRLDSGVKYGQAWSSNDGKTWTEAIGMLDQFSVQPFLAVMPGGAVVLSGGRPGIFFWINADGTGTNWKSIDFQALHNSLHPSEQIVRDHTTAYTHLVALDATHLLCIYDRVPFGWSTVPNASDETNSIWVVRLTVGK
jgi:hypothetical protein